MPAAEGGAYHTAAGRPGGHAPLPLAALPGFTRSARGRDHVLLAPESRVYAALAGWHAARGACLVSPALPGALFSMTLVEIDEGGSGAPPPPGCERALLVLKGEVDAGCGGEAARLREDGFAYWPPDAAASRLACGARGGAVVLMWEQAYRALPATHPRAAFRPRFVHGRVEDRPLLDPGAGESFTFRKLLPVDAEWDLNLHVMDFKPGESLGVKELHYNQHGLFMLEGHGVYRLGQDAWYPVTAGDAMYIGPFALQWYAALGKTRTRYIISKDTNRDPLASGSAGVAAPRL